MLTADHVRSLLDYDAQTGVFVWKVGRRRGRRAGLKKLEGYRRVTIDGRHYYEHQVAWLLTHGVWPPGQIDHIDRVRDHNWIANLRLATNQENCRNGTLRGGASAYRGVAFFKRGGKWRSYIVVDGKQLHLGYFTEEAEAARAYDAAAKCHFGQYAALNFP